MPCLKSIVSKIDTDQLRRDASCLAGSIAEQAERAAVWAAPRVNRARADLTWQIGRASCRERV